MICSFFYNIGLMSRTNDSMTLVVMGRRFHRFNVIRRHCCMSLMKIFFIWVAVSVLYMNAFISKLWSKLRKSKLVEPIVENSSSMIRLFACRNPPS